MNTCPLETLNDSDGDGHCAFEDNCPLLANPDQRDSDSLPDYTLLDDILDEEMQLVEEELLDLLLS